MTSNDFERGFERGFAVGAASSKGLPHYNHPLLSDEEVAEQIKNGIAYFTIMGRRTGKSTAQALSGLAWAIKNPGTPLRIKDHCGTLQADHHLLDTMRKMVEQLGLRNFVFSHGGCTVTFHPGANQ